MCWIPQRAEPRCHGEQTPPVLGTEEALVEPMLLARDTMLPFRAFSMKSAGIKIVPGSVPSSGCDRARGREGHPQAAAATHGRGWRGPGTYRSPGHCRRRPRPPARGRRAEETRQRGWGGDAGLAPEPPAARSSFGPRSTRHPRAAAPPGLHHRPSPRHRLVPAPASHAPGPALTLPGRHEPRPGAPPCAPAAPGGPARPDPGPTFPHESSAAPGGSAIFRPPGHVTGGARRLRRRQGAPVTSWP